MAQFYHCTANKPFTKFKTREVWCDTVPRDYGDNEVKINYNIDFARTWVTNRDVTDYPEFKLSEKQAFSNRRLYLALGGEVSRKPYNYARRQGYTAIFDEEGWCLLYPKQVKIVSFKEYN